MDVRMHGMASARGWPMTKSSIAMTICKKTYAAPPQARLSGQPYEFCARDVATEPEFPSQTAL